MTKTNSLIEPMTYGITKSGKKVSFAAEDASQTARASTEETEEKFDVELTELGKTMTLVSTSGKD